MSQNKRTGRIQQSDIIGVRSDVASGKSDSEDSHLRDVGNTSSIKEAEQNGGY